ncbi:uncharacterized protein PITG_23315 [Phytophthora infestans T30-4]|uniref:ZSWIM1/3 RNaseH-like domain-containing protein n=1 Tax=Phytophthora infestans (strain T30-4) TaxID=403677 RepID=D0NDQ5_PHYIT|nr:uncharacterized protein PITG_23315 [Phytophthora infestans T30-4]EEY56212.1 hypothetical protein PITG_23315 [Phytophthora infestans T30-4]|eukprot:XP_002903042.1 hypothetical protein PITG_23315 [Phytophthora infestans T30-4]
MEATRQKIVVKEVINVARRNADLRRQVRYQGLPDSELPLVPAEMEPYQRKFICTHGWSERDRSTGKRTSHKLSTTDCPFQMLAQATKRSDGQWSVVMKREVYAHNHCVSEDIYRSYPGIRQVPADSPLMPGIELLVESEAGTTSVYNYIRENSKHRVSMDDVHNLLRRLRVELSDNDAVAEMIMDFNRESSANVSSVHESARGDTGVLSFTSEHMRAMLDNFPEVIQMDCTHKTNQ